MKNKAMKTAHAARCRVKAILGSAALAVLATHPCWAYESGSTGADGEFSPSESQSIQLPPNGTFNYTKVTIPEGVTITYTKNASNTPVTLLVSGDVKIAGTIDVSAKQPDAANITGAGVGGPGGFNGGIGGSPGGTPSSWVDGYGGFLIGSAGKGEGGGMPAKLVKSCNSFPPYGYVKKNCMPAGGGGYYGTLPASVGGTCPATPGKVYGNSAILPLIGGSGGGGGLGGAIGQGSGGGGGGGALLIAASGTIDVSGALLANGGAPLNPGISGKDQGQGTHGGGGSGGAIRLVATTISVDGAVSAAGGTVLGEYLNNGLINDVGAYFFCSAVYSVSGYPLNTGTQHGGGGRIRFEAESGVLRSKPTTPPYVASTPNPLVIAGLPALSIVSVGGIPVRAIPTGVGDVVMPKGSANPAEVVFSTRGVTVGSTIELSIVPPSGLPITATSEPTTGVSENATASVSIALPPGQSVMQASVTYTVVAASGKAMADLAQGEPVEKVRLSATLGGESTATLITVSGKEYVVPAAALAALPG